MTEPSNASPRFQPEIQGLRAIAIILVVLAHADVPGMASGFIGVDIFFVISGYLITGLIIRELNQTNTFSFPDFFVKRIRRLFPALLTMLILVSVISALLLSPFEQTSQSTSAGYASLWVSNIYFAFSNSGYFEAGTENNLFLHTWSLGVEEQFYLIWPVLLYCLYRATTSSSTTLRHIVTGLIFISILSFAASIYLSWNHPLWGFYLMPSRAWQFAVGAIIMLLASSESLKTNKLLSTIASTVGFLCIAFSLILIKTSSQYPGFWALLPTTGTALLLLGSSPKTSNPASSILRISFLQKIGNLSYSWYLWHWPVIVLGSLLLYDERPQTKIILAAVSIVPAILSLHFVESPARQRQDVLKNSRRWLGYSICLMAVLFLGSKTWNHQTIKWQSTDDQLAIQKSLSDLPELYSMGCDKWYHSDEVNVCAFGNQNAQQKVVLFGDSIGAQWFEALAAEYATDDSLLIVLTKSSCPMVDEPFYYARIGRTYTECETWRNVALSWIADLNPDMVFLGSSDVDFNEHQWVSGSKRVFEKLSPYAKEVFVLRATPKLDFNGLHCLSRQSWQQKTIGEIGQCTSNRSDHHAENVHSWLVQAAANFENVNILDMNEYICPDGICQAEKNGITVFRDNQHLTNQYVSTMDSHMKMLVSEYLED